MSHDLFGFHKLNTGGQEKARRIQLVFEQTLARLEDISGKDGRQMSLAKTHLEEACFHAKKAMAVQKENQVDYPPDEDQMPLPT